MLLVLLAVSAARIQDEWGAGLGNELDVLADLDGDGVREIVASAPYDGGVGAVVVLDPCTGAVLHRWTGEERQGFFGFALAAGGDADADGVEDVLVTSRGPHPGGPATLEGFSGRTGERFFRVEADWSKIGQPAWIHDRDGDGGQDLAVSIDGAVELRSGRTGTLLVRFDRSDRTRTWIAARRTLDVDRDGVRELLVVRESALWILSTGDGSARRVEAGLDRELRLAGVLDDRDGDGVEEIVVHARKPGCTLRILSGRTLELVVELRVPNANVLEPAGLSHCSLDMADARDAGDLDGDGVRDLVLGLADQGVAGQAWALSGATWEPLFGFSGAGDVWEHGVFGMGTAVAALGDVDGDGCDDVAIAQVSNGAGANGALGVVSGATGDRIARWWERDLDLARAPR